MKFNAGQLKEGIKKWLSRLTYREKVIFWLCVIMAAGAILYKFPIESMIQELKLTKIEVAKNKIELEKRRRKLKEAEILKKEIQPVLEEANWNEPAGEIQNALLTRLERAAEGAQVKILNRRLQSDKEFDSYRELSAQVEFEGELKGISRFLYDLKNLPQVFDVRNLELRAKDEKQNLLRGEMLVSAIWFGKTQK